MASEFGWGAVSPEPMDWAEYQHAVQHLAEERVGRLMRQAQADEDQQFAATRAAMRG